MKHSAGHGVFFEKDHTQSIPRRIRRACQRFRVHRGLSPIFCMKAATLSQFSSTSGNILTENYGSAIRARRYLSTSFHACYFDGQTRGLPERRMSPLNILSTSTSSSSFSRLSHVVHGRLFVQKEITTPSRRNLFPRCRLAERKEMPRESSRELV